MGLRTPEFIAHRKSYILYPSDKFMVTWEIFVSLILLATCALTPLNFAFQKEFLAHTSYQVLNYIIDIFFFVDIIVNFNLAFTNEMQEMVDLRKEIFFNYFTGWFFIDLMSILPIDLLIIKIG
jgi:hypothetical protein